MINIKHFIGTKSPEILIGLGLAGMVSAIIMGITATPKALDKVEEIKEAHKDELDDRKVMGKEYVTKVAPVYIPTIAMAGASAACIIFSDRMHTKRTAAIAAAYAVSEEMLKEYQAKVVQTIGKAKEANIRNEVAKDTIEKQGEVINHIYTKSDDEVIFIDNETKLAFTSTINKMDALRNRINEQLLHQEFISIRDIVWEIPELNAKIRENPSLYGDIDYSGVNMSKGLIEEYGANYWRYEPGAFNGKPVFVWYHNSEPRERYWM